METDMLNSTIPFLVETTSNEKVERNLENILNGTLQAEQGKVEPEQEAELEQETELEENKIIDGMCIECGDQPFVVYCLVCNDNFCQVCFLNQHKRGNRLLHKVKNYHNSSADVQITGAIDSNGNNLKPVIARDFNSFAATKNLGTSGSGTGDNELMDIQQDMESNEMTATEFAQLMVQAQDLRKSSKESFLERSCYIPLRLSYEERKYLRLLEAGLSVSEYTDKIDVLIYGNKAKRIVAQIKEICSILSGLLLAADYNAGQKLFKDREFAEQQDFFSNIFELGRRHKIMNPDKMRSTYGKLIYMLQDSQFSEVQEMLNFKCVKPVQTVYRILEQYNGGLEILNDPLIEIATAEIIGLGKSRNQIESEIKKKERAIEYFAKKYSQKDLTKDLIRNCLYSIGDNNSFLRNNRDPCEKMIELLQTYFNPKTVEKDLSLAIQSGSGGARLTHGHEKQYQYVLQSLCLWREVLHDMFKLWTFAEDDLLSEDNYYKLRDTGQGLNRVQSAPKVSHMMHKILNRAQQKVGYWVGSSVIHLGDHNVPNALLFIDKYTQIYRILLPMVSCITKIDSLTSASLGRYIDDAYGSHEMAKKIILCDFFRHAFDGSGADNFMDAGSCIDGRLTSAWNYCSLLEKKPYFPLFLLTGFMGFDGQF